MPAFASLAAYRLVLFILIERVLALVAGYPITLSEVELEAHIILAKRAGLASLSVPFERELLCMTLQTLISEHLISIEADRLQLEPTAEDELRLSYQRLRERFTSQGDFEKFLRHLELSQSELIGILSRHIRVEKLISNRIKSRAVVLPEQAQAFFEAQPSRFRDVAQAQRFLVAEKQQHMLRTWMKELAQRTPVMRIALENEEGQATFFCPADTLF